MNWPSYLIQINIYLILFYTFYSVILQNETFFKWNRIYLISSAILSFVIPLLQSSWIKQMFVTDELVYVTGIIDPAALKTVQISGGSTPQSLTLYEWLFVLYIFVAAFLFIQFIWRLSRISKSFNVNRGFQAQSFFKKIKVSDNIPSREAILKHEEIHSEQLHSADVIFFELVGIINWFNPIIYLYKKSIRYIHEFIADEAASMEIGKSEYALILVSNVFNIQKEQLTNNFFNKSLLKQRIKMLNKTKSRKAAVLKYGLSVPLFAAMLLFSSAMINDEKINITGATLSSTPAQLKNVMKFSDDKIALETVETVDKNLKPEINERKLDKDVSDNDTSAIYNLTSIEVMPDYPGGIGEFLKWVGSTYKFPAAAKNANVSGRMIVQFVVEKDGRLSDIKAVRDLGYGTGEAAVELLATSKLWKPGIQNGKPVRVQYTLPLMLKVGADKKSADSLGNASKDPLNPKKPPLVILNGQEITMAEMKNVDKSNIQSIDVLKDKNAIDKYGEKGKNGVIIITMKPKE